jgi:hypothetical protein
VGSPDGFRPKSGRKRGTGGATGPNFAVRMEKTLAGGLFGGTSGDALSEAKAALDARASDVVEPDDCPVHGTFRACLNCIRAARYQLVSSSFGFC